MAEASMHIILTGLAFCLALLAPVVLAIGQPPRPGEPVLVILPPWTMAAPLIRNAGGQELGPVQALLGTVAWGKSSDFAERLRQSGAWAVLDARGVAQICGAV